MARGCFAVRLSAGFFHLFAVVLQGVELVVAAPLFQQLLVGALLNDPAVGQHDDVVGVLDGGQPVGHDQHGAHRAHLLDRKSVV